MLVTFKTSAYADITMFGDVAESLLKLMGQSGNVPGAILAQDLRAALATLQQGLAAGSEKNTPPAALDHTDDDDESARVELTTRAMPLVKLLKAAADAGENVSWDS